MRDGNARLVGNQQVCETRLDGLSTWLILASFKDSNIFICETSALWSQPHNLYQLRPNDHMNNHCLMDV